MTDSFVNAYVDGSSLVLLRRREDGQLAERRVPAEYVSFHLLGDVQEDKLRRLREHPAVRAIKIEKKDDSGWIRITWRDRETREHAIAQKKNKLNPVFGTAPIFEGDVHPIRRYLTDTGATIQKPKRLYFDLETDSRVPFAAARTGSARILSWAIVTETGEKVSQVLEADTDKAEKALLQAFWRVAADYDQLLAWNGDGFDFPVLQERTKFLGLHVRFGRWLYLDHMLVFKRMNLNTAESGDEKTSMKLQDVAMALLEEGKTDFDGAFTWPAWEMKEASSEPCPGCKKVHEDYSPRECMLRYNEQDTGLLKKIEEETGYLNLFQALAEACAVFPDSRSLHPTYQVDGFMLRMALERGTHFPTKEYRDSIEQFAGAYVMQPEAKGITRNVHVADFRRLYPSIIITWNMSPETKVVGRPDPNRPYCTCPTGTRFYTDVEGMLPAALRQLIQLREYWQKEKAKHPPGTDAWSAADRLSNAYKVAANSFYGVIGSPFSRYFDREVAESVTQSGVWLIKLTKAEAIARGWRVIYADTDSTYVVDCDEDSFRAFAKWCNESLYPEKVREMGCTVNDVWLEYEKAFDLIVFVSAKRYVARFLHYKGKRATDDSKPEVKGLEYKRGDTAYLARKLQKYAIDLLTKKLCTRVDEYERLIRQAQKHVLESVLPVEHVQITQQLTKEINEYAQRKKQSGEDAAQSPHVRIAKILRERGAEVTAGTRIAYVMLDSVEKKLIPAIDYVGDCDRHYLWEQKVFPPTQRLLQAAFPDHDWSVYEKTRPKKEKVSRTGKLTRKQMAALVAKLGESSVERHSESEQTVIEPNGDHDEETIRGGGGGEEGGSGEEPLVEAYYRSFYEEGTGAFRA